MKVIKTIIIDNNYDQLKINKHGKTTPKQIIIFCKKNNEFINKNNQSHSGKTQDAIMW